ncbi:MAG: prepilin-type N-terminal cleavage/methylation domain-containing protein [Candidatus Aminicenantes bacterium]|nr:MAG: prepilin-type N-terminal cleavage/methylation domain-containing protein [Candidatus Aminicenantes bacterium]
MMMAVIKILKKRQRKAGKNGSEGFSLIETTIAIALVGVALLALAQLFTYSVMNNQRSDRMTNSTFLAQQQIDFLRNFTATDLNTLAMSPVDEQIDVNNDGNIDFRRVTRVQASGFVWEVRVQVFPVSQLGVDVDTLINYPSQHKVRADMSTVISR